MNEPETSQPRILASVLNWHAADQTIRLLAGLQSQSVRPEIVVVDNASTDDSVKAIRDAYPELTIIESPDNLGYAGGHGLAVEYALEGEFDLVWLLNTDVELFDNTLQALLEAYLNRGLAIYSSTLVVRDQPAIADMRCYALTRDGNPNLREYSVKRGDEVSFPGQQVVEVANVTGASIVIPTEIIRRVGFMRDDFFMYWEEAEYCFRLANRGIPSLLVPGSRAIHSKAGPRDENLWLQHVMHYYALRNKLIVFHKYDGLQTVFNEVWRYRSIRSAKGWLSIVMKWVAREKLEPTDFYRIVTFAAVRDGILHRLGKTFEPNNYIQQNSTDDQIKDNRPTKAISQQP